MIGQTVLLYGSKNNKNTFFPEHLLMVASVFCSSFVKDFLQLAFELGELGALFWPAGFTG